MGIRRSMISNNKENVLNMLNSNIKTQKKEIERKEKEERA